MLLVRRFPRVPHRGIFFGLRHSHLPLLWVIVIVLVVIVVIMLLRRR